QKTESDHNCRTYYEVFVYSFCDSNGDGIGDIPGLISKLNYIEELGFNGIWLMPIMPSTTYHKYDVIDYYTIDEQYGTLEDFKT
ncbi:MAG: alpha-amylase family glycosyl hydrolase, partial [Acetivibrio sp.]